MNGVNKTNWKYTYQIYIFIFFRVQPYTRPSRLNMMAFYSKHPKWQQNPKFTPLSETTSIPIPFISGVPPLWILHFAFSVLRSATEYPCWFAIEWHILRWKGGPNQALPINNTEQQQQEKRKKKTVKKCALSGITIDDKIELRRRFIPFAVNVNSNSLYIINMVIQELLKGVRGSSI